MNKITANESAAVLCLLADLQRANVPTELDTLGSRLGWGPRRVVRLLEHLANKGLVDRPARRLTFGGLAIATALSAHQAVGTCAA